MSFEIPKNAVEEAVRRADTEIGHEVFLSPNHACLAVRSRSVRGYTRFIVNLGSVLEEIGMTGSDYMWQLADVVVSDTYREALDGDDGFTTYCFPDVIVSE